MLKKHVGSDGGVEGVHRSVVDEIGVFAYKLTSVFDDAVSLGESGVSPHLCHSVKSSEKRVLDLSQVVVAVTISARDLAKEKFLPCRSVVVGRDGLRSAGVLVSPCVVSTELFRIQPDFELSSGSSTRETSVDAYQVYDVFRAFRESHPQDVVVLLALGLVQSGVEIVVEGVVCPVPRILSREGGYGVVAQTGLAAGVALSVPKADQVLKLETVLAGLSPAMPSAGCRLAMVRAVGSDSDGAFSKPIPVRVLVAGDAQRALCNGSIRPWSLRRPRLGEMTFPLYRVGDVMTMHGGLLFGMCGIRSWSHVLGTEVGCYDAPVVVADDTVGKLKVFAQRGMLAFSLWVLWFLTSRKLLVHRCYDHQLLDGDLK